MTLLEYNKDSLELPPRLSTEDSNVEVLDIQVPLPGSGFTETFVLPSDLLELEIHPDVN